MKIVKLNSFSILLIVLFIGSIIFYVPIFTIECLWNSFLGSHYPSFEINFWQALILWLALIVLVYISGAFKFQMAIEKIDLDKDLFKKQIEELKSKQEEDKLKTEKK